MSQEHDTPSPDQAPVADGIHPEASPFEPGYQPDTLPKITVPDLAADAQGLSAEALAQVPTLTELVEATPVQEALVEEPSATAAAAAAQDLLFVATVEEPVTEPLSPEIQAEPAQADTWVQELHVRMGKLNGDIHTLNARLDRLEERNKKKA